MHQAKQTHVDRPPPSTTATSEDDDDVTPDLLRRRPSRTHFIRLGLACFNAKAPSLFRDSGLSKYQGPCIRQAFDGPLHVLYSLASLSRFSFSILARRVGSQHLCTKYVRAIPFAGITNQSIFYASINLGEIYASPALISQRLPNTHEHFSYKSPISHLVHL